MFKKSRFVPWSSKISVSKPPAFKIYEENELPELQSHRQSVEDDEDLDFFINTIERDLKRQTPINYIPIVNPKHLQQTCLDIASRDGKTKFVKQLLQQGAKPNIVNETHNRAPIHFATEGGHVDTLATLLKKSTINPNLEAGEQTALHIAVNKYNIKCAALLLEKGVSASIPDSMGLTALHLAAMKQQQEMTELILKKCRPQPDLDRYKDHNDKTTQEVIKQLLPELPLHVEQKRYLKHYLSINDETNFLKNIEFVVSDISSVEAKDLLEMTVQRDFYKAACRILNTFEFTSNLSHVAQVAVQRGHYKILQKILNTNVEDVEINILLLDTCMELGKPEINSITDCLKCLKIILEQKYVNVRFCDGKGITPLHYAAKAGCNEAVNLLLHRGSYIGHMNSFDEPPIANISASTLSSFFDECIESRNEWTNMYTIEFNYRCLMPHEIVWKHNSFCVTREMEVFEYISHYDHLKQLLKHPLLSSFLYLKWQKIRHLLHANFIFYMTFYIMLNAYIFNTFNNSAFENEKQIVNCSIEMDLKNSSEVVNYVCHNNSTLRILIIMLLLPIILWEVLQFMCRPQRYLADLEKWLQFVVISLSLVLLFDMGFQTMTIMTIIQNVLILLSAWKIVILLSQYPYMSTAVEMFRMVFLNFVRFLIPYVIIILAFALVFHMLFKDEKNNNFYYPIHSLFKTVIMFTGEFDLNDIPFDTYPIWSRIVFQLFVFLITIVLFNLINGLAVNNITEIMNKAELVGLIARIRLLVYFEDLTTIKPWFIRWCYDRYLFVKFPCKIFLFPHSRTNGKIGFGPYNKHYVRSDFKSNMKYWFQIKHEDEFWATEKLDSNIIKQAERIISNKNQLADNKAIMIALNNLKKELEDLKVAFNLTDNVIDLDPYIEKRASASYQPTTHDYQPTILRS